VFCPYKDIKDLFPKKIMDMRLFKKIIDECSNYKVERIILYMSNEPLTDPYIIERINYAKEKVPWACVHILTNGLLLTDEMRKGLINSKLDWIGISFHGIKKETIKKAMGINFDMAFERINRFIEEAKKRKNIGEYIMITFLKHKYLTDEEKDETIKYWKKKGLQRISYFAGPISRAGNVKDLPRTYHRGKVVSCRSIWTEKMIHIVEDGKVVLCCMDWRREVVLGDLNKESIYKVWNGRRRDVWRMIYGKERMPENFLCRRCEEAVVENSYINRKQQKALLVILPSWRIDTPPLGIASISTYLRNNNIMTEVIDLNIEIYHRVDKEKKALWGMENSSLWRVPSLFYKRVYPLFISEIEEIAEKIVERDFKFVGFFVYAPNRLFTKEVIKKIKMRDKDKIVIVGGEGVYDVLERKVFGEGLVDYFLIGEGEETFLKLIKGETPDGITKEVNDSIHSAFLESFSNFPLITYEEFDLQRYKEKALCLLMNRGCIFQCNFCNDWRYIGRLRTRKAEDIYKEIEFHFYRNNIRKFYFNDQVINVNLKELNKLCELLIEAPFKIEWVALAIPWEYLNYGLLLKMKKAGCITLNYGIESGSDKVRKLMNKKITTKEVEKVLRDTKSVGIDTQINLMVGFPGETERDFIETVEFVKRNKDYISGITNLNMCNAVLGSSLVIEKEKFNIEFPPDPEARDTHWFMKDKSNTYEIRLRRCKELIDLVEKLNLPLFTTNFPSIDFRKSREGDRINFAEIDDKTGETTNINNKKYDFLLINLPPWAQENPHIGVGYLCEYLRRQGLKPAVLDLNKRFFSNHSDFRMLWHVENKNFWSNENTFPLIWDIFKADIESAIEEIDFYGCDILGFSVVDPKERLTIELIRRIKREYPYKKIILGGAATSTKEQRKIFIDNVPGLIDVFVVGEGEKVLFSLIERMKNSSDIGAVKGIIFKKDNNWIDNGLYLQDISDIPFPTYEEFDMDKYGKSLLVEWSRGCIGNCAFCKNWRLFGGYRPKGIDKIIAELKYHINRYNIREFTVVDNILNGNVKLLEGICERIMKDGLNITWSGQIAPRKEMSFEVFEKMKRAGCECLQIGVESGSDKVLKRMRKIYTSEIAERNIRNAKKAGIKTEVFIIIGFPSEGRKEFMQTYNFIKRNRKWIDTIKSINTLHLIAGTDVYEKREEFGIKPLPSEDWHYLWETYDGNRYTVRKRRAQKILNLAWDLGIKVMETNIKEGKENTFKVIEGKSPQERIELLKSSINNLQQLPGKRIKRIRKKRSFFKYFVLILLSFYIFFYIVYFWMYMMVRNKMLLGGRKD